MANCKRYMTRSRVGNNNRWIRVSNFQELRGKLTPEPEKAVDDFLPEHTPKKPREAPEPTEKSSARVGSERKREGLDRETDLEKLDATVRGLTAQIAVGLAHVVGGEAVWNKIREDKYNLNPARKAVLPKKVVKWLSELQKVKQHYIVLLEVKRYKQLLMSLPGWEIRPIISKPVTGIKGYYGGNIGKKRYWFNEE